MSLRLKKSLSYIFIGLLLYLVAEIASGTYSHDETLDCTLLPEFQFGETNFGTVALKQIYDAQDLNCVKCHYHQDKLKTCQGHENLRCIDCHVELKDLYEYKRHDEDLPSAIKACISCHEDYDKTHDILHKDVEIKDKSHKKPDCLDCHDPHETNNVKGFNNIVNKCTACHDDEYTDFTLSKHYSEFLEKNPNTPTCLKCHDHSQPLQREKVLLLCAKCHLNPEKHSTDKVIKVTGYFTEYHGRISLSNVLHDKEVETLECKNCHENHKINKLNTMPKQKCCANKDCHEGVPSDFHKAMTPHGRSNLNADTDFWAWFFNLLGKIVLSGCLFLALLDNVLSTFFFKQKKISSETNEIE